MKTQHVYQPVMLKTLLQGHGRASTRQIAAAFLALERALQIDHILPRKHGGKDLIENLQALCWLCNANKGDRDATDFRVVRENRDARQEGCPFCALPPERLVSQNSLAVAFYDRFPVTPLHTLVIPRRHAITWFDLYEPERRSIGLLLDTARAVVLQRDPSVTGFNIGMNSERMQGRPSFMRMSTSSQGGGATSRTRAEVSGE
jgi:hypothetical protein